MHIANGREEMRVRLYGLALETPFKEGARPLMYAIEVP